MAKTLLTTPRGVAKWPRVSGQPDKKYNRWKVDLTIEGAEGVALAKTINAAMKEHFASAQKEAGKKKLTMAKPSYEKGEDGNYTFKFTQVASGVSKKTGKPWEFRPVLYQANGTPYTDEPRVGSGTVMRVMYELYPWVVKGEAGIRLALAGVKIIKLVEFSSVTDEMKQDESDDEDAPASKASEDDAEEDDAPKGKEADEPEDDDF